MPSQDESTALICWFVGRAIELSFDAAYPLSSSTVTSCVLLFVGEFGRGHILKYNLLGAMTQKPHVSRAAGI